MSASARWLALLLLPAGLRAQNAIGGGRMGQLYQQHCAICHGDRGQGGLGGPLTAGKWKHGGTDEDHARIIRDGLPDLGMQAFGEMLDEKEIRGLVIYLRELELLANRPEAPPLTDGVVVTRHQRYRIESLLDHPARLWGVSFFPQGGMIVTEIEGPIRLVTADGKVGPPVSDTPQVVRHGQGGMLDVAVHPDYGRNGWIYLAFAEGEGNSSITSVVRGRIRDNRWQDQEVIFRAAAEHRGTAGVHFGSRIAFRDGYVYFSIGDRGTPPQAQEITRPNGKIHRLREDGTVPPDNPFVKEAGALPSIWSFGHRNPQALAFRPGTDELWSTEHGPRGGDELNRILPGRNYGWPKVTFGMNYNGSPITEHTQLPGLEPPVWHWTPSIAVCGMAFADLKVYPGWAGDVLAGGLSGQVVERLRVNAEGLQEREVILKDQGRVRDVKTGPDGHLYVILEGRGSRLIRLVPVPPEN